MLTVHDLPHFLFLNETFFLKNSRIHYRLCSEEFINFIFVGVYMHAYAKAVIGISNMLLKKLSEIPTFF
jgi:hypothetical protein